MDEELKAILIDLVDKHGMSEVLGYIAEIAAEQGWSDIDEQLANVIDDINAGLTGEGDGDDAGGNQEDQGPHS
jgi:hypothetical protein